MAACHITHLLLPQPGLRPETGNTFDLSGRLRFNDLAANLTWYVSNYDDLIRQPARIYNGEVAYQRMNVGKARIQGLELDLRYRLARDFSLKAVATYTHGTDRTAGKPLSYIAPLTGVLGLQFERGPFYASADWRLSRRKTRIDPTQERETGGYGVLDLYAGWNLKAFGPALAKTTLRLGIENIFNKTFVNPTTQLGMKAPTTYTNPLVEPGRNVKLTLTSTF